MYMFTQKQKMTNEEFAEKWESSKEKFYRFVYCYVKNEHDAMEVLSEATYRAFSSKDSLKEPKYFDTWMCRILIRCAYDYLKQNKRFLPYDDFIEEPEAVNEQDLSDMRIDIYRMLETISPEDRTLLILKFFEERTFEDISKIVELPVNTVKSKVYRSLERLRRTQKGEAK